jgi:CheY-like chemotaxis protein
VSLTVLIVEDSPTQALRARMGIQKAGLKAESVESGEAALARLREGGVDVVCSDVRMPGMDGFQLLEAIKEDADLARTPVILWSATVTESEDAEFALALGASGFLEKGLPNDELVEHLKAAVAKAA